MQGTYYEHTMGDECSYKFERKKLDSRNARKERKKKNMTEVLSSQKCVVIINFL